MPRIASTRVVNQKGYGFIGGIISLIFSIIIAIVALRFVFRLLGANADNGFVSWIYSISQPLVSPFFGIFGQDASVLSGRFEYESLIALIVYGVIGSILSGIFGRTWRHTPTI